MHVLVANLDTGLHLLERGKQVGLLGPVATGLLAKVFDDLLGMDLLLDVDGHGRNFEIFAVLLVLRLSDELRVERGVVRVADERRGILRHHRPLFGRGDVGTLVLVLDRLYWHLASCAGCGLLRGSS
jgi:hypothetical protein